MVSFTATIQQFQDKGEKTGWTYIEIHEGIALELKPGNRKSFRVKGKLDKYPIKGIALIPMGGGGFILPLNATMRKALHKKKGGMVDVQLAVDDNPLTVPPEFMICLDDEPKAAAFFQQLKTSHRNYYIKWLGAVKSEAAIAKRIAQAIDALAKGFDFIDLMKSLKAVPHEKLPSKK